MYFLHFQFAIFQDLIKTIDPLKPFEGFNRILNQFRLRQCVKQLEKEERGQKSIQEQPTKPSNQKKKKIDPINIFEFYVFQSGKKDISDKLIFQQQLNMFKYLLKVLLTPWVHTQIRAQRFEERCSRYQKLNSQRTDNRWDKY
ncbi:Hypothetical_protein [Hexamita inflata]|uniref:Hypothetical_protein n=1 Tax=Hexamita inflata TaxID=28002 RepID=A0AA86UV44_9EUKA|nr:Hypothetical protein HINF_LOCUS53627 [Hexamita inflata]